MINGLKKMFSPFSALSPHSHLLPLSGELELGRKLKTDIHSHLIPGIDDGAKSLEESIAILEAFEHLGYEVVKLDRVVFAGLTKKDLPRGKWRHLTPKELDFLKII